jgi:hypothetical protein
MRPNVKVIDATTATLTWTNTRGMKHQVQWSNDLVTWTDVTPAPTAAYDTNGNWTDTSANVTKKFYRIKRTAS